MSCSVWTQLSRTLFIRSSVRSGPVLGRSFVLLAAKPGLNPVFRPVPLAIRQQHSVATAQISEAQISTPAIINALDAGKDASEEALPKFSHLKDVINRRILGTLAEKPFRLTTMTPVQAEVLGLLPELAEPYDPEKPQTAPRDLLVRAKTGTGKTLAFLIPALEARIKAIDAHVARVAQDSGLTPSRGLLESAKRQFTTKNTGVVIISPTRELATQIAREASKLTRNLDFGVHLFVGGESKSKQMSGFRNGTHDIIVATPGRLRDLLSSYKEVADSISKTQMLILDEADTLLDMGFQPDILAIQEFMPKAPERQTFLFSATVSPAIRSVAKASLAKHHRYINCVSEDASPVHAHIPQYHTVLPSADHQIPHILRLIAHDQLTSPGKSKIIVFLPTTKMTQLYNDILREVHRDTLPAGRNTNIYEIHSKRSMESRTRASNLFRNDKSGASVLITSDVSARGVDYPGVTRVIQVGIPSSTEQYIHRVGRTGRAGTQGRGDLILLPWERNFVTWQMNELPLKPLTVDDLTSQALELARKHDADPKAFFGGEPPIVKPAGTGSYLRQRPLLKSSIAPTVNDIQRTVSEVTPNMNPEAVSETFMSLLGYYLGKTGELRMDRTDILEGCKLWTTEACGFEQPPHVSRGFLERMGLGDQRKMDSVRRGGFKAPRQNSWGLRGAQNRQESFGERRGREWNKGGDEGRKEYVGTSRRQDSFGERGGREWNKGGDGGRKDYVRNSRPQDSFGERRDWGGRRERERKWDGERSPRRPESRSRDNFDF